jgi:hypothetical protein
MFVLNPSIRPCRGACSRPGMGARLFPSRNPDRALNRDPSGWSTITTMITITIKKNTPDRGSMTQGILFSIKADYDQEVDYQRRYFS